MADKKVEALKIVEEGLKELETAKGSVAVAVQKLSRVARLLNNEEIYIWAEIQLANPLYIDVISPLITEIKLQLKKQEELQNFDDAEKIISTFSDCKIIYEKHIEPCLDYKLSTKHGSLKSVKFIEDRIDYISKLRRFKDGVYQLSSLHQHLDYIRKTAHQYLSELHNKLKFSGTITSSFDLLKNAVDDRLLDLDPEIAEQLMLAFKSVSSDNKEEWSQALATCRRLLESLADKLYPASDLVIGKRTFKQNQFVNRLWQFMNESIASDSNRELAQMHVNYLGSWLEKANKITNKGVHDEVSQLEATKAIFHIYLMLADLLDYLDPSAVSKPTKLKITEASLDEIESLLNVKRDVAKAIVVARVNNKGLTIEQLAEVKGVGPKTVATAKEVFEF